MDEQKYATMFSKVLGAMQSVNARYDPEHDAGNANAVDMYLYQAVGALAEMVVMLEHDIKDLNTAAVMGRKGGSSTSPRKLAAVRANGKLGGRPKKQ